MGDGKITKSLDFGLVQKPILMIRVLKATSIGDNPMIAGKIWSEKSSENHGKHRSVEYKT